MIIFFKMLELFALNMLKIKTFHVILVTFEFFSLNYIWIVLFIH
jgi:hypothetical protein